MTHLDCWTHCKSYSVVCCDDWKHREAVSEKWFGKSFVPLLFHMVISWFPSAVSRRRGDRWEVWERADCFTFQFVHFRAGWRNKQLYYRPVALQTVNSLAVYSYHRRLPLITFNVGATCRLLRLKWFYVVNEQVSPWLWASEKINYVLNEDWTGWPKHCFMLEESRIYLYSLTLAFPHLNLPPCVFLLSFPTFNLTHFSSFSLIPGSIFSSISLHLSARVSDSELTQVLMWLFHHFSIICSSQSSRSPPSPAETSSLACHFVFFPLHLNDTNLVSPRHLSQWECFPVVGANIEMRWRDTEEQTDVGGKWRDKVEVSLTGKEENWNR